MLNTISATFGRAALAVSSVLTDSSHFTSFDLVWVVRLCCRFEILTHDFHRLGLEMACLLRCWHLPGFPSVSNETWIHPREIAASCGGAD